MSNRLPVLAGEIGAAEAQIRRNANIMADHIIQAGHRLIEAKALVEHGGWRTWLGEHVGMPERTASAYMRIAASGLKSATVADLGIRGALVALSRVKLQLPSTGYVGILRAGEIRPGRRVHERLGVIKQTSNEHYDVRGHWWPIKSEILYWENCKKEDFIIRMLKDETFERMVRAFEFRATKNAIKSGPLLSKAIQEVMGGPFYKIEIVTEDHPLACRIWEFGETALKDADREEPYRSKLSSSGVLVSGELWPEAHA